MYPCRLGSAQPTAPLYLGPATNASAIPRTQQWAFIFLYPWRLKAGILLVQSGNTQAIVATTVVIFGSRTADARLRSLGQIRIGVTRFGISLTLVCWIC